MATESDRDAMLKVVEASAAPAAIGPYSAGIKVPAGAGLVFVSGQLPLDAASGQMLEGSIGALVTKALTNALAIAEAAGSSLQEIAKVTVFLTDLGDFAAVNEAYAAFFGDWHPARAVVEVSGLPRSSPVEIEMIGVTK